MFVCRWWPKQRANRRTWSTPSTLCQPKARSRVWIRTCCCSKPRRPPRSAAWENAWTSSRATAMRRWRRRRRPNVTPTEPPPVSRPQASFQVPQPLRLPRSPRLYRPAPSCIYLFNSSGGSFRLVKVCLHFYSFSFSVIFLSLQCCHLCWKVNIIWNGPCGN